MLLRVGSYHELGENNTPNMRSEFKQLCCFSLVYSISTAVSVSLQTPIPTAIGAFRHLNQIPRLRKVYSGLFDHFRGSCIADRYTLYRIKCRAYLNSQLLDVLHQQQVSQRLLLVVRDHLSVQANPAQLFQMISWIEPSKKL